MNLIKTVLIVVFKLMEDANWWWKKAHGEIKDELGWWYLQLLYCEEYSVSAGDQFTAVLFDTCEKRTFCSSLRWVSCGQVRSHVEIPFNLQCSEASEPGWRSSPRLFTTWGPPRWRETWWTSTCLGVGWFWLRTWPRFEAPPPGTSMSSASCRASTPIAWWSWVFPVTSLDIRWGRTHTRTQGSWVLKYWLIIHVNTMQCKCFSLFIAF